MDYGTEKKTDSGIGLEDEERIEKTKKEDDAELSVERIFEQEEVPSWRRQLTVRAFAVSLMLSVMFCFIVMKLNLTTGIIPSLNVSAGLLGFFFVKTWTKVVAKSGLLRQPFTRQENTVIQTCVVASSGIAFSGGFGSYLFAMSKGVAQQSEHTKDVFDYKNPSLGWMIGFLFVVSFLGLFSVVPLRKIMIIDFKLTYPSGTATAHLINSFHTPQGAKLANSAHWASWTEQSLGCPDNGTNDYEIQSFSVESGLLTGSWVETASSNIVYIRKQVRQLGKFFSFSFLWGFFQWFFTAGDNCGFANFPTLGLEAYKYKFFFDFSATYVGVGMICPHIINVSVLVGGILSWGIMWPLLEKKEGDWYPLNLPSSNLQGLQGYKVFIGIAMILGDGLYNFFKVLCRTMAGLFIKFHERNQIPVAESSSPTSKSRSYDNQIRTRLFLTDQIPMWFAVGGYVSIAVVSTLTLPHIFHHLKWYHILVMYLFAPVLAFCNAFGCGLTDWSLASTYGKLAIFTIGAWAGPANGGILAGLAACGVMMNIVSTASDLMQDFKTGYLTLASPRSMFVSQVVGTAMGCIISPCVFWIFYKAFPDLGLPTSSYPAPFATIYYNMAKLGAEGFSALPENCLKLCYVFFAAAIFINLLRDCLGKKRSWFIPLPMAMAIPFYLGSYFAIDMCVGSLILFIWQKINRAKADAFGPAVASGLICGDGIWTLPSSVLALAGVKPPICMKFLSRATNTRVDKFIGS